MQIMTEIAAQIPNMEIRQSQSQGLYFFNGGTAYPDVTAALEQAKQALRARFADLDIDTTGRKAILLKSREVGNDKVVYEVWFPRSGSIKTFTYNKYYNVRNEPAYEPALPSRWGQDTLRTLPWIDGLTSAAPAPYSY
jgi:hypothetical protein